MSFRIIPRLDIKGENLVKGIHLEGLRVLGVPSEFAMQYYLGEADELMIQDVVASLYGRNNLSHIIEEITRQVFIPITVGGGIRSLVDINTMLRSGADRVAINTAAIQNPNFIKEAAENFGTSTIVATIEAIKSPNGDYYAFMDNGRESSGKKVVEWAMELEALGAGEIFLTSVDAEGTGKGFPVELAKSVFSKTSIPVTLHGGFGSVGAVKEVLGEIPDLNAVAIASSFHYNLIKEGGLKTNVDSTIEKKGLELFSVRGLKSSLNG